MSSNGIIPASPSVCARTGAGAGRSVRSQHAELVSLPVRHSRAGWDGGPGCRDVGSSLYADPNVSLALV
jgi:hypothetical protein